MTSECAKTQEIVNAEAVTRYAWYILHVGCRRIRGRSPRARTTHEQAASFTLWWARTALTSEPGGGAIRSTRQQLRNGTAIQRTAAPGPAHPSALPPACPDYSALKLQGESATQHDTTRAAMVGGRVRRRAQQRPPPPRPPLSEIIITWNTSGHPIAHGNLSRSVLGKTLSMGSSTFLHQATVMRGSM
jgi:hypothetical protein